MTGEPEWWRAQQPTAVVPAGWGWGRNQGLTGSYRGALPGAEEPEGGDDALRPLHVFRASVADVAVRLDNAHLAVAWSEFDGCHFRQRTGPVRNSHGDTAQGSFGNKPSIYRGCTFERVRFKLLGGFSLAQARFEDCTFLSCRWEGHFAHDADLVGCRFVGRMNGCVWFGTGSTVGRAARRNVVEGNDFTQTRFTTNVGWRRDFPIADQHWPDDYRPVVDAWL